MGPHAAVGGGERGSPPRDRLPAALDRQGRQRRDADGRRRQGAPPEDQGHRVGRQKGFAAPVKRRFQAADIHGGGGGQGCNSIDI